MRIPRDLSGKSLIKKLGKLGYEPIRQVGSHIRLTTKENGTHHITIPEHNPLKVGTLSNILNDIAVHFQTTKEDILSRIL